MELSQANAAILADEIDRQQLSTEEMVRCMADFGLNDEEIAEQLKLFGRLQ